MGVYGTTYKSAFQGLGKPSIKLEFEDNDELLAFQQRMQEAGDGPDAPDDGGGNFTQGERVLDSLSRMATGRPYLKATPGGEMTSNEEPVVWNEEKGEFEPLNGYGDFYTVRDMRKRSRKEPGDVATNKNLQFTKDNDRKINNFDRSLYELTNGVNSWNYGEKLKDTHWRTLTVKYNSDNGKYFTTITLFFPYTLRRDLDKPTFTGYASGVDVDVDLNNLYNYSYYIDSRNYVDRQRLEGFVKDDYYKTLLIEAIKSGYKQLQQRLINAKNSRLANSPSNIAEAERLIKYYKMLYSDPSKYDLLDKAYGGGFKNISNKLEKFLGEGGLVLDGLGKAGDLYLVRDLRTRAKKEPGELAANKNLKFEKQKNDTIKNFNKELYAAPTLANGNKEINGKTYYPVKFGYKYGKNDRYISEMYLFMPKIYNASENKMRGSWRSFDVVIDADKLYNIERNPYSGGFQAYEDEATLRENTNNALRQAFADVQRNVDYQKEQIEKEKNSPWKSDDMIAKREKYLKEAYKELKYFIMFYANYGKYPAWIMSDNNGGDYPAKMAEDIPEGYIDRSIFAANLAAPGDLGKTANNTLYNNNDILDCRGLTPTYRILPNYDAFFAPAQNVNTFAGVGLTDTKKLILDICKAHYKDCAKIAAYLKADTKLQSVFNLWHWMRHNIRYEYDREGREEVRTPLRTYADRRRGVDCDCLSVFAWCVLKCMGYNPAFELVSFKGKKQPSHILVNLDGIRLDRVWFVFNSLPPGVTGSEIYRITTNEDIAGLFN